MNLIKRLKSPTPKLFVIIRNLFSTLAVSAAGLQAYATQVLHNPDWYPEWAQDWAKLVALAAIVIAFISQLPVEDIDKFKDESKEGAADPGSVPGETKE